MTEFSVPLLDGRLRAIAAELDVPDADLMATAVLRRLAEAPPRTRRSPSGAGRLRRAVDAANHRRRRTVALLCAATASTVLAIPPARAAVADWIGIGGVRIERVGDLAPPATDFPLAGEPGPPDAANSRSVAKMIETLGLVQVATPADAAGIVGFTPRLVGDPALGAPDAIAAGQADGIAQVTSIWRSGTGRPPSAGWPEVAVLHTEFVSGNGLAFLKGLPPGATIDQVQIGANLGYWISGAGHSVEQFDADGTVRTETWRLAGDTLVWTRDGHTHRIESTLGQGPTVALAETVGQS